MAAAPSISLHVEPSASSPPAGHLAVANRGPEAVRLWEPASSWGDPAWSFDVLADDRPIRVPRRPQRYTVNLPATREVAPGATERWAFDLGDGSWEIDAASNALRAPDARLVAVYDAPSTPEADQLDVFTGPLRSEPVALHAP